MGPKATLVSQARILCRGVMIRVRQTRIGNRRCVRSSIREQELGKNERNYPRPMLRISTTTWRRYVMSKLSGRRAKNVEENVKSGLRWIGTGTHHKVPMFPPQSTCPLSAEHWTASRDL